MQVLTKLLRDIVESIPPGLGLKANKLRRFCQRLVICWHPSKKTSSRFTGIPTANRGSQFEVTAVLHHAHGFQYTAHTKLIWADGTESLCQARGSGAKTSHIVKSYRCKV